MPIEQGGSSPEEMEQEKTRFFGSEKANEINLLARGLLLSDDPQEYLEGSMLEQLLRASLRNPAADRTEIEQELDSSINFDGRNGQKLDPELKAAALQKAMERFDQLQEMRDVLKANGAKNLGWRIKLKFYILQFIIN